VRVDVDMDVVAADAAHGGVPFASPTVEQHQCLPRLQAQHLDVPRGGRRQCERAGRGERRVDVQARRHRANMKGPDVIRIGP
jgi:hypothetical protein